MSSDNCAKARISVALVTRNRPESLERTLDSLRCQDDQPFEVVVSDDSDPPQQQAVREVTQRYQCRYLEGPRRGLYANRNHAALACRGTHIRTMDDDHEFPAGHWQACQRAVSSDDQSVWIIGEFKPWEQVGEGPPPCPAQLHPRGFSKPPANTQDCWSLSDGAVIFPRQIFDEGVRYADFFKFGVSYLEFGSRLHWLGYRIRQLRDTHVLHHVDPACRSFMDAEMDLAARIFAMLCHSRIYQPTVWNRMLTHAEICRRLLQGGKMARRAMRAGHEAYRSHRTRLLQIDSSARGGAGHESC